VSDTSQQNRQRNALHSVSCQNVDMCWTLVAEEPHRPTILNLEHFPLKAQGKRGLSYLYLSSSPRKDEQRIASTIGKQRARIPPWPSLTPVCRSLVVLWSPPWSAINRPCLRLPVAITALVVALDNMRMFGLSCCFLRCTVQYDLHPGFSTAISPILNLNNHMNLLHCLYVYTYTRRQWSWLGLHPPAILHIFL
jgi:hypothetical protein